MPELPEVETVKNELSPHIVGRKITDVVLLWPGLVKEPSAEEFRKRLTGQKITGISRRGKYMPVSLSSGESLIMHLKMTGSLLVQEASDEEPRFARAILRLDNGTDVVFRDPRKFGVLRLVKDADSVIGKLGVEPFDEAFTPKRLGEILTARKAPVKILLIEQELIAGIGSMYADEALFAAKIYPLRPGSSLTDAEIKKLHTEIRRVLREGIKNKGASVDTYYRPDGSRGSAHEQFKVAHRYKEPCPACGTPIQRIKIRGRGSYFCPECQPDPT